MLPVVVETDLRSFNRWIGDIERRQYPFATARALTVTAAKARDAVRSDMPHRFETRSEWIQKGVLSTRASKTDWPHPFAIVGDRDWFMEYQEEGGVKTARGGGRLAVPRDSIREGGTHKGRIPKKDRPAPILKNRRRGYFVRELTQGRAKGKEAILRRAGQDRYPLQVIYIFEPSVRVTPRFEFDAQVTASVQSTFAADFSFIFDQAIAGARR